MNLNHRATPESKKYSGERIAKAGKQLRIYKKLSDEEFEETMNVISYFRQIHETPLQSALGVLQDITKKVDKNALYAKRMKRTESIYTKLLRFETMSLYKMQDIGGCRAIIDNNKRLRTVLRQLKKLPQFINAEGKVKVNDYILNPKDDGYRSTHIIGKFPDKDGKLRSIEVQLRTPIQHYWATAVEIVDLFTKQSLKTNQGERKWKELFIEVSKQFEIMDNIPNFSTLMIEKRYELYVKQQRKNAGKAIFDIESTEYRAYRRCHELIAELNVIEIMHGFAQSLQWVEEDMNISEKNGFVVIVVNTKLRKMSATVFSKEQSTEAEEMYTEEERKASQKHIVVAMVATPNIGELKAAYPNYFADSTQFLDGLHVINESFRDLRKSLVRSDKIGFG